MAAVERGVPMLIEKPLATDLGESARVLKAITDAKLDAVVGYTQRFRRKWLAAKEKVRTGALGDVTLVTSRAFMNRLVAIDNYKRTDDPTTISPMVISGTHALDIVMWYMEAKTPVECYARSIDKVLGPLYQGIDATAGMIMFSDGSVYHLNISWALPVTWPGAVYSLEVGINGTDGVLTIDDTHRDMVLAVSAPQEEGYAPDKSRLVDFMGSYPPGDMALGELRGPMREETDSWLNRVALGVPTQAATAAEAHNADADQGARPVGEAQAAGEAAARAGARSARRRDACIIDDLSRTVNTGDDGGELGGTNENGSAGLRSPAGRHRADLAQEDVAAFYQGKTMRLMVGIGVGSGYDINARLLARHMAAHIPGNPTIIVQNQPGAGSLTMTNALYNAGPFDGTVIGASFNGMPTTPLLQPGGARFDPAKLNWLGSTNRETHAHYVWHTAPVQSLAGRHQDRGDDGRAGAGLDPVRLPGARQRAVRLQVQGDHRLREHAEDPPGDGARRGARHVAPTGRRSRRSTSAGSPRRRSGSSRSGRCGSIPSSATCRWRSTSPRPTPTAGDAAGAGAARIRPAVLPAAERAGGAARGAAPRVRRHHEGSRPIWPRPRSSRSTSTR